ncbi:hypothetical protein [Nostoc sp.]|uniref:hypothetical protein n=1 Tax=Nostoc sp. TaxID=1180 RepID=UPI002FF9546D
MLPKKAAPQLMNALASKNRRHRRTKPNLFVPLREQNLTNPQRCSERLVSKVEPCRSVPNSLLQL